MLNLNYVDWELEDTRRKACPRSAVQLQLLVISPQSWDGVSPHDPIIRSHKRERVQGTIRDPWIHDL